MMILMLMLRNGNDYDLMAVMIFSFL